jgi:hypothetical protein
VRRVSEDKARHVGGRVKTRRRKEIKDPKMKNIAATKGIIIYIVPIKTSNSTRLTWHCPNGCNTMAEASDHKSSEDYYTPAQLSSLWMENWFLTFKRGAWMDNSNVSAVMNPINQEYDQYHPYVCNACKRGPLQQTSVFRCSGCHVLRYCCKAHQKHDWKTHKKWCKAFQNVRSQMGEDDGISDKESFRAVSKKMTAMIEPQYDAELHSAQFQMVAMQPRCRRCFRPGTNKGVDLIVCGRCSGVAVCKDCLGDTSTQQWSSFHPNVEECDGHRLAICCTGMVVEQGEPLIGTSSSNCTTLFQPEHWLEYFRVKGKELPMSQMMKMAPVPAFLSDCLTLPLTLHHVLSLPESDIRDRSRLVLHIVGAAGAELLAMISFVELARLNPKLKYLRIVMIGPSLPKGFFPAEGTSLNEFLEVDETKVACDGKILLRTGLYHDVLGQVESPDFIIAYNAGIDEPTYFATWAPTLQLIAKMDIVLCITGYNHMEVEDDCKKLRDLGVGILIPPSANPFRGFRPFLDPMREPSDFIYSNASFALAKGKS